MLGALLIAPIFALFRLQGVGSHAVDTPDYFNAFSSWKDIVSGLGWGLGYFWSINSFDIFCEAWYTN